MVAPMDAELTGGVGILPRFNVFDMGAIHPDRHIMFRLARNRAGMTPNAGAIIDNESKISHLRLFQAIGDVLYRQADRETAQQPSDIPISVRASRDSFRFGDGFGDHQAGLKPAKLEHEDSYRQRWNQYIGPPGAKISLAAGFK